MRVFNDMIGARLLEIDDTHIVLDRSGDIYEFTYELESDGCICTYADVKANLLFEGDPPAITRIETVSSVDEDEGESCMKVTFFGQDKHYKNVGKIAEAKYVAGSGSGYHYGSTVTIVCKDITFNQEYDRDQYNRGYHDGLNVYKWISTKDRLQICGVPVIVTYDSGYVAIATLYCLSDGRYVWENARGHQHCTDAITAWQPLPEPYEEDE